MQETLGARLKILREKSGMTQEEIAAICNIHQATYNGYEKDRRKPDLETLTKLADVLQTSTDYLLGRYSLKEQMKTFFNAGIKTGQKAKKIYKEEKEKENKKAKKI